MAAPSFAIRARKSLIALETETRCVCQTGLTKIVRHFATRQQQNTNAVKMGEGNVLPIIGMVKTVQHSVTAVR